MQLTVLISHEHFAIEHLVISQNVVQHLLIEILGRTLESDLHPTSFLDLEIDVSAMTRVRERVHWTR